MRVSNLDMAKSPRIISYLAVFATALKLFGRELPDAATQREMVENMRAYATHYIANLPNFFCAQVIHQFEAGKKPNHWKKGDSLTSKLIFSQGKEIRDLELVNDKPVKPGRFVRRPLETEGEFGILLANVLDENSDATIAWNRWETLRGKELAVFSYNIDGAHSTLSLSLSSVGTAIVPYKGEIFTDPDTGTVWRITNVPYDIPPDVLTRSIATTIDYGSIIISDRSYFLPVQASVRLDTGTGNVMNQSEFRDYRKFETDSRITFSTAASDPALSPVAKFLPSALPN